MASEVKYFVEAEDVYIWDGGRRRLPHPHSTWNPVGDDPAGRAWRILADTLGYNATDDADAQAAIAERADACCEDFARYFITRKSPDEVVEISQEEVRWWLERWPEVPPRRIYLGDPHDDGYSLYTSNRQEKVGEVFWQTDVGTGGNPGWVLRLDREEYLPDSVEEILQHIRRHDYELADEDASGRIAALADSSV